MTPAERGGIANGIWLCQTHAKLIDGDEAKFTAALLKEMKAEAEDRAKARIGRTAVAQAVFKAEVSTCFYVKSYRAAYVPAVIVNEGGSPVTIKKVELKIGNDRFVPNKARENLALEGCEWFEPGPLRLEAADAKAGAWYFGWSLAGGGPYVEATPGASVELVLSPVVGPDVLLQLDLVHPEDSAASPRAGTVAARVLPDPAHREHDRELFLGLEACLPEVRIRSIADRLQTSDDYMSSDMKALNEFLDAAKLEANRFCDEVLNDQLSRFVASMQKLVAFMAVHFFIYPKDQIGVDDLQLAMHPDLNQDRSGHAGPKEIAAYDAFQRELDALVEALRSGYRAYRSAVRSALAL